MIFWNFQFQADSRKTSISANPYLFSIFFKLQSNLYIIMTIPTNFHSVWTFQWAARKENIFENSSLTPLLIGLKFLEFQSNLYIIMTNHTNFHSDWTIQWVARKENIFEKSSLTPLLIGLKFNITFSKDGNLDFKGAALTLIIENLLLIFEDF